LFGVLLSLQLRLRPLVARLEVTAAAVDAPIEVLVVVVVAAAAAVPSAALTVEVGEACPEVVVEKAAASQLAVSMVDGD
jgi:hypothetical protein